MRQIDNRLYNIELFLETKFGNEFRNFGKNQNGEITENGEMQGGKKKRSIKKKRSTKPKRKSTKKSVKK